MFEGIKKGFEYLFGLLADLFGFLLDGIVAIFKPIIDLVFGIFYLIYKLGLVLVEIIFVLVSVAKLGLGLIQGLFNTLFSLDYDGTGASFPGSVGDALQNLAPLFNALQMNKIGYVVMFSIWLFTAFAAVKIIQTFRGGNDS